MGLDGFGEVRWYEMYCTHFLGGDAGTCCTVLCCAVLETADGGW